MEQWKKSELRTPPALKRPLDQAKWVEPKKLLGSEKWPGSQMLLGLKKGLGSKD